MNNDKTYEPCYLKAVDIVRGENRASVALLQRRLTIGYVRAVKIMERMERDGVVSAMDRLGHREVISTKDRP